MNRARRNFSFLFFPSFSLTFRNSLVNFKFLASEHTTVFLALNISTVYFFSFKNSLCSPILNSHRCLVLLAISVCLSPFLSFAHQRWLPSRHMVRTFRSVFFTRDFGNTCIAKPQSILFINFDKSPPPIYRN